MSGKDLLESMSLVDEQLIAEAGALGMPKKKSPAKRWKRLSATAACLAALTALAATATAGGLHPQIQEWFMGRFTMLTKMDAGEAQSEEFGHFARYIGASQTLGDVTVTVDSHTAGMHCSWMLVNVGGLPFTNKSEYSFRKWKVKIHGKDVGGSIRKLGVNEDGILQFVFSHHGPLEPDLATGFSHYDRERWDIELILDDLMADTAGERDVVQEGRWKVSFWDSMVGVKAVNLGDAQVTFLDSEDGQEKSILLEHIELSETGMSFTCHDRDALHIPSPTLLFWDENIREVAVSFTGGSPTSGAYLCEFPFPVNLGQVQSIRIGDIKLRIPNGQK